MILPRHDHAAGLVSPRNASPQEKGAFDTKQKELMSGRSTKDLLLQIFLCTRKMFFSWLPQFWDQVKNKKPLSGHLTQLN